jgi:DNA-binding IscR family transcriptional regulator
LQIIRALEGPVSLTACVDGAEGDCNVESLCPMRGNWDRVNRAIRDALAGVTLADMAVNFHRIEPPARAEARA